MAEVEEGWRTSIPVSSAANLLLALAEGRIAQFVRSDFATVPTQAWDEQWSLVTATLAEISLPGSIEKRLNPVLLPVLMHEI